MTNAREKRRLLGLLALLAPLPLPLNDALEWWFLLIYVLAIAYFLQRVERGEERWLSNRSLNVLGFLYVPVLIFEMSRALAIGEVLDPLLHLILFLLVVKLLSLRHEREKWHILVAVFFVFAASMASSSHIAIAVFLIAFVSLATYVLARLAHLYVVAGLGLDRQAPSAALSLRRPLTMGVVLVVLVAVPVFAMLPRFGDPFIFGEGTLGAQRIAGFSDEVDLSQTSAIRGNRTVVMRLSFERGRAPADLRLKGATYSRYRDNAWHRTGLDDGGRVIARSGRFRLLRREVTPTNEVEVFLQPLGSASLPLPLAATALDGLPFQMIARDGGGAFSMSRRPREALRFQVELGDEPIIQAGTSDQALASALDVAGVTDRMRELAAQVMGSGDEDDRIDRLEGYLLENHAYSLDLVNRTGSQPLERFLFEEKRGHCELFASSMVVLLRSQGIPARLVGGFLGVEHNTLEGYDVVRQDNAHTWVEAYSAQRGWQAYDPTPPEGRPSASPWSLRLAAAQFYDAVIFRWDRYVLSYGSADQAGIFERVREALGGLWQALASLFEDDDPAPATPAFEEVEPEAAPTSRPATRSRPVQWLLLLPLIASIVAVVALLWMRTRQVPTSARRFYRRLRDRLRHAGQPVTDAMAPRSFVRLVAAAAPAAAGAGQTLVGLYLKESFGERTLDAAERRSVRHAFEEITAALRQTKSRQAKRQRH